IDDALLIPRFDREACAGKLLRHGLETLSSAAGLSAYGRRGDHAAFCAAILAFSADAKSDLLEYLRRDILNVALRNTDNHGRNSAFIKYAQGPVTLAPLYDFAPMFLDPEGIARASRWPDSLEPVTGRPAWGEIVKSFQRHIDQEEALAFLTEQQLKVEALPITMRACGVEEYVIQQVTRRCAEIAADLRDAERGVDQLG
ncbi:MAG: HipA domain-containing protein, partial [Desulfuromonadales bacterium]|nr:HipA domain-containing protein [Desulfuromonadales bacterium]